MMLEGGERAMLEGPKLVDLGDTVGEREGGQYWWWILAWGLTAMEDVGRVGRRGADDGEGGRRGGGRHGGDECERRGEERDGLSFPRGF